MAERARVRGVPFRAAVTAGRQVGEGVTATRATSFSFEGLVLDTQRYELRRGASVVAVEPHVSTSSCISS